MKIGYARVSTGDQNLDMQIDALKKAGCEKIFCEKASGALEKREELNRALNYMRKGDILVIWKLSRLGRSLKLLISIVDDLNKKGIEIESLTEKIDTTSVGGKLFFHIIAAIDDFHRSIIVENVTQGLRVARENGKIGGRPKKMTVDKINQLKLMANDEYNFPGPTRMASALGVSRQTVMRYLQKLFP
jgi:DNA invertase Pin-like site-specific DNA recombinase